MSARTIKNPATISGKGELSSESVVIINAEGFSNILTTDITDGALLVNGEPISGGGGGGGVTKIVAGDNVTIEPVEGVGEVTINSTFDAGVTKLIAGDNIILNPVDGVGEVTITAGTSGVVSVSGSGAGISVTTSPEGAVTVSNTLPATNTFNTVVVGSSTTVTLSCPSANRLNVQGGLNTSSIINTPSVNLTSQTETCELTSSSTGGFLVNGAPIGANVFGATIYDPHTIPANSSLVINLSIDVGTVSSFIPNASTNYSFSGITNQENMCAIWSGYSGGGPGYLNGIVNTAVIFTNPLATSCDISTITVSMINNV